MKDTPMNPVLKTWIGLNDFLRDCTMDEAEKLLAEEERGRRRKIFLLRIHARVNKLRRAQERTALLEKVTR